MTPALKSLLLLAAVAGLPSLGLAGTAQDNWTGLCAKCHAPDGSGKTRMGAKFHIKNYTDPAVQAAFTDAVLLQSILQGSTGPDKGHMPVYRDKLTDAEGKDLVALIRTFKK